jgi:uncharacterized membrane protein YkoI
VEYHKFASLGLVLLVVGVLGGVSGATPIPMASQSQSAVTDATERWNGGDRAALQADRGTDALQQGGVNLSEVNVSALEAIGLAQNETDGKAVVVTLTTQNQTPAYNVTVLHENRSITQVTVDATEPRVIGVQSNVTVVQRQFLGGEAFDYAELRTVGEAIRLVQNRTNGTVVNAGIRRGELTYGIALRTPEGQQTQALVTATNESILGIRTSNATRPPTPNATTTGS